MALIDLNGLGHFKDKENAMIAADYSATKTYAVGDYVYYNGTLYRCTTAIATAEAWTSGHWTAAKLADDLTAQSEAIVGIQNVAEGVQESALPICDTKENVYQNISDGAGNVAVEDVVVIVEPTPDGVEPTVYRTGKNILPLTVENIKSRNTSGTWSGNTYSYNGISYTILLKDNDVVGINVSGTASGDSNLFLISFLDYLKNGVSYILTGCPSGGALTTYSLRWVTTDFGNASSDLGLGTTLVYSDSWTRVYIDIKSGTTISGIFYPMIRLESEKDTTFEPYSFDSASISTTMYGGVANLTKGTATNTYKGKQLKDLTWIRESNSTYTRFYTIGLQGQAKPTPNNDTVGGVFCDGYTTDTVNAIFGEGKNLVIAVSSTGAISISDNRYANATEFLSANGEKYLAYEVISAEQTSFDSVSLTTAKGKNVIWTNTSAVSVTYRADSMLYNDTHHYMFVEEYKRYKETQVAEYLTVGLPVLELFGDVTGMTKDNAVNLKFEYKGDSGECTLKWQGSSSIAYQKKNYTIKFNKNMTFSDDWGSHKKYVLKANYIDPTHARNVVSCKLWGQIVKSRSTQNEHLYPLVNGGAIDGFPVIVVLNGMFHGLYTLNIPKDDWMFGMTGEVQYECIVGAEDHTEPTRFNATITEADLRAETYFSVEYAPDDENIGWIATSLSQAISSVMNATGSGDKQTIDQYIDIDSAIDYYIFMCLILGIDCTDKNYILATFEGTKWYFSAYDLDSTYGIHWAGGQYLSSKYTPTFASYATLHRLMNWIYNYDKATLKARYAELRANVLSVSNVTNMFYNFGVRIPKPIKDMEYLKWNLIPSTSTSDLAQLTAWYRERVEIMDAEIDAL